MLPSGDYMFKVSDKGTRTRCKMCSKLTIKTSDANGASSPNGVVLVSLFVSLLLTLKLFHTLF